MPVGSKVSIISSKQPTKKTKVGYDIVTEQIPGVPNHRKFVTPSGNVTRLVLSSARVIGPADLDPRNVDERRILNAKVRAGFVAWGECPVATGALKLPDEKPCAGHDGAGTFWRRNPNRPGAFIEDECCPHIEELIKRRQEAQTKKNVATNDAFRSQPQRVLDLIQERTVSELADAIENRSSKSKNVASGGRSGSPKAKGTTSNAKKE